MQSRAAMFAAPRNALARVLALVCLLAGLRADPASAGGGRGAPRQRLRDMAALRSAAKRHPFTRKIIDRVLASRGRTIDSVGDISAERLAERVGWVPLGADPELRRVTVATVTRKARQRSRGLRRLIDERPAEAAWDIVFIGAGVHTAIAANTLANLDTDDPIRMLTIDGADDIGGQFRQLGSTVARNSANRPARKGGKLRRGFGNKNPSSGPWGDPDLDGQEWPEVGIVADTASVNLFASGSDFLLGERVDRVEFRDDVDGGDAWPARYRVTMGDGRAVYANAVARSTGLGKPKVSGIDAPSLALIEGERARIDVEKPDDVPDLLYYTDAMRLANRSKNGRDAYRARPNRPRPFLQLAGLKLKSSPPTTLRVTDAANKATTFPLEEAISVSYEEGPKTWSVQLEDGRVLSLKRVVAEVANREVVLQPGDSLEKLATALETAENMGATPVRVKRTPFRRQVRAPIIRGEERMSGLAARASNQPLTIRNDLNQLVALDQIADVFTDDGASVTIVQKDGSGFRVAGPLRVFNSNGATQLVQVEPGDALLAAPGDQPRPVIAVIGGRDSGRTFLEYLYGQAPASAYNGGGKVDSAQRGEIGDVEWYVGDNGPADCPAFLQGTRARYLRLTGKVRDAGDGQPSRARLNKARVTRVRKLPSGRYQLIDSRGQTRVVDRVVFATGYENAANEDGSLEAISDTVDGLEGQRIVAKRVVGRDIYRFGPAAGNDVVGADERYSTDENAGSIYAFAPRDRRFAKTVLARVVRAVAKLDTPGLERPAEIKLAAGSSAAAIAAAGARGDRLETPLTDLVIRAEMTDLMTQVKGDASLETMTFRVIRNAGGGLEVQGFNHAGADQLAALIADSALLVDQLEDATAAGNAVEFSVPLVKGRPVRTQLRVSM